jgi:hypothetical protein
MNIFSFSPSEIQTSLNGGLCVAEFELKLDDLGMTSETSQAVSYVGLQSRCKAMPGLKPRLSSA